MRLVAIIAAATLAGCSGVVDAGNTADNGVLPAGAETAVTNVADNSLPAGLAELVEATVPGMKIGEVERKERAGRIYYDVEGTNTDGSEIEIDVLAGADGKLTAVEIQRDITWASAPAQVRTAAASKKDAFEPARVIESRQVEDGAVIYELFARGRTDEPAMEVRFHNGTASVLNERWAH